MARRETQRTKNIDVNRSFIPVDPNAFPENYIVVTSEDSPDKNKPVVAYEGHNFLPTPYGYKSYFGTNAELGIDALTSRVDEIITFQTQAYENILVALCEDGIWTKRANAAGAWVHDIVLAVPVAGYIRNWTYCVISNELYCYRAQGASYYKISAISEFAEFSNALSAVDPLTINYINTGTLLIGTYAYAVAPIVAGRLQPATAYASITNAAAGANRLTFKTIVGVTTYRIYRTFNSVTKYYDMVLVTAPTSIVTQYFDDEGLVEWVTPAEGVNVYPLSYQAGEVKTITPNFLNMEGQQGIFKAGGRLGFWDSLNSIAWSNLDDFSDFTPAILTMAGNTIFQEVLGKIVTIIGMAEDFVIYATKSIVLIRQTESTSQIWASKLLVKGTGIILPREVAVSTPDTKHFAYASNGLYKIEKGDAEVIVPEVTDYLKESNLPVYLRVIEGRFLFLGILDGTYIDGLVGNTEFTLPPEALVYETPIYDAAQIDDIVIDYTSMCTVLNKVGGRGAPDNPTTDEQQSQGEAARQGAGAPQKAPDTFYKPIWACYLSKAPVGGNIVWEHNPCTATSLGGGVPNHAMSPSDAVFDHTTRGALVYTPSPYLDGWTIERFIAVQTALWEAEENARKSYISALTSRVSPTSTAYANGSSHAGMPNGSLATPANTTSFCNLGTILTEYTGPELRIGPCSFSLFRLGVYYNQYNTITSTKYVADPNTTYVVGPLAEFSAGASIHNPYTDIASAAADVRAVATLQYVAPFPFFPYWMINPVEIGSYSTANGALVLQFQLYDNTNGTWYAYDTTIKEVTITPSTQERYKATRFAYNAAVDGDSVLVGDEPYCTITEWEYKDVNGVTRRVAANACAMTYPSPPPTKASLGDKAGNGNGELSINGKDVGSIYDAGSGSICGLQYESVTIPAIQATPINWYVPPVSVPPTSFLLQDGSIGPIYPTIPGALVYDLQLQKWGKMKQKYKVLVDYMPLNNSTANIVNYETFGMIGGVLLESGKIALFDENPIDSYIKYGKIGYYRTGFTKAEEVRVSFRSPSTGTILLETSLNGSVIEGTLSKASVFTEQTELVFYPSSSGRWHNVVVKGNYDIKHLEFRGTIVGNR